MPRKQTFLMFLFSTLLASAAQAQEQKHHPQVSVDLVSRAAMNLKAYDEAIKGLSKENRLYLDKIVSEGNELERPLQILYVKTLEWNRCRRAALISVGREKDYSLYRQREELRYSDSVASFQSDVLAKASVIDPMSLKNKIAADGVISMARVKQLYLSEMAVASPEKQRYDCEALDKFLDDYATNAIF